MEANRFTELMEYFGIKQSDIVEKTGIPKSAISMYVSGQRKPRQNRLTLIADAYGVSETWLMGYDVPMFKDDDQSQDAGELLGEVFRDDPIKLIRLIRIFQKMNPPTKDIYLLIGEELLGKGVQ